MMKLFFSAKSIVLTLCLCTTSALTWAGVNPKPFVVPELKEWHGAEGQMALSGKYVVKGGKAAAEVGQMFAADYGSLMGAQLTLKNGKPSKGDIVLVLKADKALGQEGYRISIGDVTTVSAATVKGLKWGTRTVLQMSEQNRSNGGALPKGNIVDTPEYGLRGFMMDCGRKFIPMDYLRSLVKTMAYYKMNTLQIHLNDNGFRQFFDNDWDKTQAAFRLECDTYPGLTARDGSYTKKEFIDLQKLAEQYGVDIIPEIDVPAHTLAFTHYKPEIGSKEYGMDHLDLFNPETYKFVDGLFKEYLDGKEPVFRGKVVHIGTDEYSNAKKDVVEKFRYFTDRYIKYVESFGKQAAVWGALTHANGDTKVKSDNVIMSCWYNGYADPKEMKRQGYKLISIPDGLTYIVPAAGYYYDYLNCESLYNKWTPAQIGNEKFKENDPAILGGMFAVWNDHAGNGISVKDIHDRLYPALQTLSVKFWRGVETSMPYAEFNTLRHKLSEAPGVNEAARWTSGKTLSIAQLQPGQTTGEEEVGYGYRVDFNIKGAAEEKGTVLFESKNAAFYLADP
ncbi:family 20 glycosylhydrolase, partial [Prevotella sp.]|uniref:family 20 glycosylhydrolase n=1 Tax=Prevotella sp. TaxID=59823 RepID=UPI0025CCC7FD